MACVVGDACTNAERVLTSGQNLRIDDLSSAIRQHPNHTSDKPGAKPCANRGETRKPQGLRHIESQACSSPAWIAVLQNESARARQKGKSCLDDKADIPAGSDSSADMAVAGMVSKACHDQYQHGRRVETTYCATSFAPLCSCQRSTRCGDCVR